MSIKKYIFLIFLLLISCNSSNNESFDSLKDAYYKWYKKHNLLTDTYYFENQFSKKNNKIIDEHIFDLKNFDLELSQISYRQLNDNLKLDYQIIFNDIEKKIFNYSNLNKHKSIDRNPLDEIYKLLINIFYNPDLQQFEKIAILKKQLFYLNNFISVLINNNKELYKNDLDGLNNKIDILVEFIDQIPSLLNINIVLYEELNDLLINTKKQFFLYRNHINYEIDYIDTNLNLKIFNDDIYRFYIDNYLKGSGYSFDSIIEFVINNIENIKVDIFSQSLDFYLAENDEPVWVDKQDTVDVINYVINKNFRNNNIQKSNLVNSIKYQYDKINNYIVSLDSKNYFIDKNIFFTNSSDYNIMNSFVDINFNDCIIDTNYKNIYFNKYSLHQYIFTNIIPHLNISKSILSNDNNIRLIKEDYYNLALSNMINYALIDQFSGEDELFKLYFYINLLQTHLKILVQHEYFYNKKSEDQIIDFLVDNGFANLSESKIIFNEINKIDRIYLVEYVIYLHLVNLYDQYCIIDNRYDFGEFLDKIIKQGYIPFFMHR
tara:strand:+ start:2360 stop:3997 length:1638 start_codon:yes stop_codon:yes gene_type:complete